MQFDAILYMASTWVLPVLLAITLHEAAHGFVAHRLGDDTASRLGRRHFCSDTRSPCQLIFMLCVTPAAI